MATIRFTKAFAGICIFSLLFAQGCASTPKLPSPSPPLGEELRASLGTVGVVSAGAPLGAGVSGPIGFGNEAGEGALDGALTGGGLGAVGGAIYGLACGPIFWFCSPVFAAGFGLIGGVAGAATGGLIKGASAIPTETATDLEAALFEEISDYDLQADLRRRVLARAASTSVGNVRDLGTGYAMFSAGGLEDAVDLSAALDTVLEIVITEIALTGEGGIDPSFALSITVEARLIRVSDNRLLWRDTRIPFESTPADVSAWTARDSGHLKSEISNGLETLAQQICEQIFGEA